MILVANSEGWPGVPHAAQALAAGERAMDAIEAGIRLVEADERVRTVGRGGWPNILGEVELDAAIMDGDTRRTGAAPLRCPVCEVRSLYSPDAPI